jgi:hypothetical protein
MGFRHKAQIKKIKTMKKQILFIAVTIAPILFSCTKEKITPPTEQAATGAATPPSTAGAKVNNLSVGLEGLFRFDGNLKDQIGKLADGVPTALMTHGVMYTQDRYGNANSAILFTGDYGVDIFHVPTLQNMSLAAWVQYTAPPPSTAPGVPPVISRFAVSPNGPTLGQANDQFITSISTPMTTSVFSGPVDAHWHHLVATYDGTALKFYVDGNYMGNSINPNPFAAYDYEYNIGYFPSLDFWKGSIDDLRFYSRTLTAKDVSALYNL